MKLNERRSERKRERERVCAIGAERWEEVRIWNELNDDWDKVDDTSEQHTHVCGVSLFWSLENYLLHILHNFLAFSRIFRVEFLVLHLSFHQRLHQLFIFGLFSLMRVCVVCRTECSLDSGWRSVGAFLIQFLWPKTQISVHIFLAWLTHCQCISFFSSSFSFVASAQSEIGLNSHSISTLLHMFSSTLVCVSH